MLTKVKWGTGHRYKDGADWLPGVTTIISGGVPKPALPNWYAEQAAAYVVDHWDDLLDMEPSARRKAVQAHPRTVVNAAAERGKAIHKLGEALANGLDASVPTDLVGPVRAYAQWFDTWEPMEVQSEVSVANRRWAYAGTLDLLATIDGTRWLLDVKTGNGLWAEHAMQLAAYRYAEVMLTEDGSEQPMPEVDACGLIHVLPDATRLVPVLADAEQFRAFLHAREVYRWGRACDQSSPLGEALMPGTPITLGVLR